MMSTSVCRSVCLSASISPELRARYSPTFYAYPWLGSPLAALRYVIYFRFYGRRHMAHNEPYAGGAGLTLVYLAKS